MDLGLSLRLKNNFAAGTGGVVESWWLSGGVSASDCLAAYQSISADSYAASKVNLANPGTYDITNGASYPTWNAATGWTFDGVDDYLDTNLPGIDTATTIIVYINNFNPVDQNSNVVVSTTDNDWNTETSIFLAYVGAPTNAWKADYLFLYNGKWYSELGEIITTGTPYVFGSSISGKYKDGSKTVWSSIPNDYSLVTLNSYIIGAVYSPDLQSFGKLDVLALAIYNATLTDDQVSAITTALQAL